MTYDTSHAEVASSINGRGESISCSLQHVLSFVGLVPHNQSDDNDACHKIFLGSVSEWLRRWIRNPLGSTRAGSNPAAVVFILHNKSIYYISPVIGNYAARQIQYEIYTLWFRTIIDIHLEIWVHIAAVISF